MITVGTSSLSYNHARNFVNLPFEDIIFKKVYDLYKIPAYLNYIFFGKVKYKYVNRFNDLAFNNVNLYHFFNTITPVKRPWVVTFETSLPRQELDFRKGYDWLAGDYCKKIIPYSQRAYNIQAYYLERYPEYKQVIQSKMSIIQPAQKVLLDDFAQKNFYSEELIFTFTGSAFFRKGGWEILQVFEKAKTLGLPVRLNLISKLEREGYRDEHITDKMVESTKKIIASNPLITHYVSLPNSKVLEILRGSHVVLLPSWGETYGYSVLEGMATACVPITTDLAPFPEFVKNEHGYLIEVDKIFMDDVKSNLENPFINFEMYKKNSDKVVIKLLEIIETLLNNRNILMEKALNSIKYIEKYHNPLDRVNQLTDIYIQAIS